MWTLSGFADEIDPDLEPSADVLNRLGITLHRVAQRLGRQRARPVRRSARRGREDAGRPFDRGLLDRLAHREDQHRGRLRRPSAADGPGPAGGGPPQGALHPAVLVLPARGPEAGGLPRRGDPADAGADRTGRRPRRGAAAREREGDLRRRSRPGAGHRRVGRLAAAATGLGRRELRAVRGSALHRGYQKLRPHTVYIQVKDALLASGEVVPAGEGDGEVRETIRALQADGYDGFFSMEPHLASANPLGGFTGADEFVRATKAFTDILRQRRNPVRMSTTTPPLRFAVVGAGVIGDGARPRHHRPSPSPPN